MISKTEYQILECVHVALQELRDNYNIPDNEPHLLNAFELVEDIRNNYLAEISFANKEDDNPNSVGYYGYNQKTDNYYPNLDD